MTYGLYGAQPYDNLYDTMSYGNPLDYTGGMEQVYYPATNMSGLSSDTFVPSQPSVKKDDEDGLGFVGWATILGTAGAIAYGIKKGKFNGMANWVKEKFTKLFSQNTNAKAAEAATTTEAATAAKAAEAATTTEAATAAKAAKAAKKSKVTKKVVPTSTQKIIEETLPERTRPLSGAARANKQALYERVFNKQEI